MTCAIVIGSFLLTDFVHLNLAQCRKIFGDVPILVSDDKSDASDKIQEVASRFNADFITSDVRRDHFAGDAMAFVNGLAFAAHHKCDVMIKISQRLVPSTSEFKSLVLDPFENPAIDLVCPGKIDVKTIRTPAATFFSKMGLLSDVVAIRTSALTAEDFIGEYRQKFQTSKDVHNSLVEGLIDSLLQVRLKGRGHVSQELANPSQPKAYLRKAQSVPAEYEELAKSHGMASHFDTSEWGLLLGRKNYHPRPKVV